MGDRDLKVCAVCGIVLERYGPGRERSPEDRWMHTRELIGQSDHVAVPVDYGDVPVNTKCDFCYADTVQASVWTVPASDFEMPPVAGAPGNMSLGNWAACDECATLIRRRRWTQLVKRALDAFLAQNDIQALTRAEIKRHLTVSYDRLSIHMTGPVRPWRAGDERGE